MNDSYKNYEYYRNKQGLSDYKISQIAGISKSSISDWKSGKHQPQIKTLNKIAEVLGVDVNAFFNQPRVIDFEVEGKSIPMILATPEENFQNAADFSNRIIKYGVMFGNRTYELSAEEYRELKNAVDVFIVSWLRSKKQR